MNRSQTVQSAANNVQDMATEDVDDEHDERNSARPIESIFANKIYTPNGSQSIPATSSEASRTPKHFFAKILGP